MAAAFYLFLTALLALFLQPRVALVRTLRGLPGYLCALGLTLFLVTWANFLLFVVAGWSEVSYWGSWAIVIVPLILLSEVWTLQTRSFASWLAQPAFEQVKDWRHLDAWFVFIAAFVTIRFYVGLDIDSDGNVWTTFNFVDTAFHLSVANAFLAAPHFPPMDLDMAPFPLKYHFIADFMVAHLGRLGWTPMTAIWFMNLVSSLVMVGSLWSACERWLKLPSRWTMITVLIFLFLNAAAVNLVHYALLHPRYFEPNDLFYGLIRFTYFNFESSQRNMLEPQRGLLFSLPIVLLILEAGYGAPDEPGDPRPARRRLLEAFCLVCLLPLSHIVAFGVLSFTLLPRLIANFRWFLAKSWIWLPVFIIGLLQLFYLAAYGPPTNANFSEWAFGHILPLRDFSNLPVYLRRIAFWFFADGDFLFWGLLFGTCAFAWPAKAPPEAQPGGGLRAFLVRWKWYFVVCGGFFALINVFRYSPDWGDSNKFVFFLNFGLALVIGLGSARWIHGRLKFFSYFLWAFFFVLCAGPALYAFYDNVVASAHGRGTVLLFETNGQRAAAWARTSLRPGDVILTAAYTTFHFVTPLGAQPTLAGIYGDSNPYQQPGRKEAIRRIYENADFSLLRDLHVRYVCVSRHERREYKLNPKWFEFMRTGRFVAFSSGLGPSDAHAVYIFDLRALRGP